MSIQFVREFNLIKPKYLCLIIDICGYLDNVANNGTLHICVECGLWTQEVGFEYYKNKLKSVSDLNIVRCEACC